MGIFDEAHRLKNTKSSIRESVLELSINWKLLLTGRQHANTARQQPDCADDTPCRVVHFNLRETPFGHAEGIF